MAKILIGIAMYQPHQLFLESLPKFYSAIRNKHDIEIYIVSGMDLATAQNEIAEHFLTTTNSHLLMLEDDHWGHTVEMLDTLLNMNAAVAGVKYYSRHYPYMCCQVLNSGRKELNKRYKGHPVHQKGVVECDLIPFGMTLIKKETFSYLVRPYFRYNITEEGYSKVATDTDFSDRLREKGVVLKATFDYCLTHRGVDDSNVDKYREWGKEKYKELQMINRLRKSRNKKPITISQYFAKQKGIDETNN